jgi:hypothetical protein
VVSRPLEGEAPVIDLVIGYSRANASPTLKLFLARADELVVRLSEGRDNHTEGSAGDVR